MGFRYRKSINLGGGFRINLSKSGIGYSWGFPGYRHTYSANGTQRKTYSIPGTGISYVEDIGNNKKNSNNNVNYNEDSKLITGETKHYQNINISNMGKDDIILNQINKLRKIDMIANICLITIYFIPIGIILKLLIAFKWKIDLSYEMDEMNSKKFEYLNKFLLEILNNKKIWQISTSTNVYNTKYNAGANNNVTRNEIRITRKMPWYITHNIDVYCMNLKDEKIYFTPDRMIIYKKGGKIGCKDYKDIIANFSFTNFVETESVPKDAEIISYTWKYVNRNGGPDKRFSNNIRIPVCMYGEISLESADGINILLNCSNYNLIKEIQDNYTKFLEYHNTIINMYQNTDMNLETLDDIELGKSQENLNVNFNDNVEKESLNKNFNYDNREKNNETDLIPALHVNTDIELINSNNDEHVEHIIQITSNTNELIDSNEEQIDCDTNELIESHKEKHIIPIIKKVFSLICSLLSNIFIAFSAFVVYGCITDKMYLAMLCWILIILIFIPKIKVYLVEKYPKIKHLMIPIRILLIFIGIILVGITAP